MRGRSSCSSDATGRASSRSHEDHTSISAAPDDLRSRSRTAAVHSLSQCLHAHRSACRSVDVSCIVCLLFESVCACMCVDCIDVCFESDRFPAKKDFTRWKPVQLASETYDNTPTLALLEHFEAPWRSQVLLLPGASFSTVMVKKRSVPIMANFEPFFLRSVNECGADFWWKYSQDTALQEIPRRNSVIYFWAGPSLVEVAVRTASWLVSAISHPRRVCAPMLMLGESEFLELGRARR